MFNRIVLIIIGFALAYFALWAGNDLAPLGISGWVAEHANGTQVMEVLAWGVLNIIAVVLGWISFIICMETLHKEQPMNDPDSIMAGSILAICASFLFGEFAQPLGVGTWWTVWDFLLVIGLAPIGVYATKEILADLFWR